MSTDTSVPHPRVSGTAQAAMDPFDAALFATLTQAAPVAVAFFDTELRCRRANEAMARLLGVAAEALVDRRPDRKSVV